MHFDPSSLCWCRNSPQTARSVLDCSYREQRRPYLPHTKQKTTHCIGLLSFAEDSYYHIIPHARCCCSDFSAVSAIIPSEEFCPKTHDSYRPPDCSASRSNGNPADMIISYTIHTPLVFFLRRSLLGKESLSRLADRTRKSRHLLEQLSARGSVHLKKKTERLIDLVAEKSDGDQINKHSDGTHRKCGGKSFKSFSKEVSVTHNAPFSRTLLVNKCVVEGPGAGGLLRQLRQCQRCTTWATCFVLTNLQTPTPRQGWTYPAPRNTNA